MLDDNALCWKLYSKFLSYPQSELFIYWTVFQLWELSSDVSTTWRVYSQSILLVKKINDNRYMQTGFSKLYQMRTVRFPKLVVILPVF